MPEVAELVGDELDAAVGKAIGAPPILGHYVSNDGGKSFVCHWTDTRGYRDARRDAERWLKRKQRERIYADDYEIVTKNVWPRYSSDPNAFRELWDTLLRRWIIRVTDTGVAAEVELLEAQFGKSHRAIAPSVSVALCRAALAIEPHVPTEAGRQAIAEMQHPTQVAQREAVIKMSREAEEAENQ